MIKSEYVGRLAGAITELEWAKHEISNDYRTIGAPEQVQDIEHIINQITTLIAVHCAKNVGEL